MAKVSLVLSDVDGTLVTPDKRLTEATRRAVRRLGEAGIAFAVASSRPPVGLRMLVEPLGLTLPMGAFNGGSLVAPDLSIIEEHLIPPTAAATAVGVLADWEVDIWVFAAGRWLLRDPDGPYTDRERRTLQAEPTAVPDFRDALGTASKIVGVSRDFDRLARCEAALREAVGAGALAARSQPYYLDVTPPGLDKGTVVTALARRLGIPREEIVTIGDMENDVPMFRAAGFGIAMGNAATAVKAQAAAVIEASNDEDGFALAMERFVLSRAR